ncbi:hypothetical protein B0H11DRAFT_1932347 [Mycena galericulata]|nr:hypothetical protein B0H11DRAFT_1932347 [Mycena galericulata]
MDRKKHKHIEMEEAGPLHAGGDIGEVATHYEWQNKTRPVFFIAGWRPQDEDNLTYEMDWPAQASRGQTPATAWLAPEDVTEMMSMVPSRISEYNQELLGKFFTVWHFKFKHLKGLTDYIFESDLGGIAPARKAKLAIWDEMSCLSKFGLRTGPKVKKVKVKSMQVQKRKVSHTK